jgi:hypothetical protein
MSSEYQSHSDWLLQEQFVLGKSGTEEKCEDLLVCSSRFVGLIDSYSGFAPSVNSLSQATVGRLIGIEVLEAFKAATKNDDIYEVVSDATRRVKALKISLDADSRHMGGCFFCVFDLQTNQIFRVGDCWFMTDSDVNKPTLAVEEPLTEIRVAYLQARLLSGESIADLMEGQPERAILTEYLKVKDYYSNSWGSDRGYGVINGDDVPVGFVETFDVPEFTQRVCIGTDGYPEPGQTLEILESRLARIVASDPLCINQYRGPKGLLPGNLSFDDRAFISLQKRAETKRLNGRAFSA